MRTLFIDTHYIDIHIILFEDDTIIKEEHILNEKHNSTFLVPSLKKVIDGEDFDEVVVCNGPGSFTGVRLGITVAKTLAYCLSKPIKVLSYFDMMAYSLDEKEYTFGMSDGNGYFIGKYENFKPVQDYYYINNNDYAKLNNIKTDVAIDYKKILNHLKDVQSVNPHAVKPLYIKLIGVEYDQKN